MKLESVLKRTAELSKDEKEMVKAMEGLRIINPTYHWCRDWDFMVICDKDDAFSGCNCFKSKLKL